MNLTIMTPSRNRPENMKNAIKSLKETAFKPEEIEFIVRVDDDDVMLEEYKKIPDIKLIIGKRGRGYADTGIFYEEMVKVATGKWLMIWGDDGRMIGKDWDRLFYSYENKIVYAENWIFFALPKKVTTKCEFSPTAHPDTWWMQIGAFLPEYCLNAKWIFTHIRQEDQVLKDRNVSLTTSTPAHFTYATNEILWLCHKKVLETFKES